MTGSLSRLLAVTALALPMIATHARAADVAAKPDAVDLAALYYYAAQHQDARVKAETERLTLKFPGFELPKDLYQPQGTKVSEAPLWALYEKDDYAGIDARIAELQKQNPGWSPSEDFTSKLSRRKLRVTLTKASQAKDWEGVIAAAKGLDPAKETEPDLLWMLVDAYHEAGMKEAAAAVYKSMLFRPKEVRLPDPVLVTTLQKAMRDFEPAEVKSAMATLWPEPQLVTGLKAINDDFIRLDVADFNQRSERREPIAEKDIQRLRDLVAARGEVRDMSLLGWYLLKLRQPKDAEPLFARALDAEPSPEFAKGLYLSVAQQDRTEDAYAIAADHLGDLADDPDFLMNALATRFAKPQLGPVDAKAVEAYSTTILKTKSADHAETLAWYAYNSGQFQASEAWFAEAWNWQEKPERLKGLALSYLRQGKKKEFKALQQQFGDLYPDMWAELAHPQPTGVKIGQAAAIAMPASALPVQEAVQTQKAERKAPTHGYAAAYEAKHYGDCVREIDSMGGVGQVAPEADLMRGWCHLSLGHVSDARASFTAALAGKGQVRSDAAYGAALAALRVKLTDEAEAVVSTYPLDAQKEKEIRAEIYWQRARSAFDHQQYQAVLDALNARIALVPESADLSKLRAWAHAKLGHAAEAKAIFQKLNRQISDPDITRGLAALND